MFSKNQAIPQSAHTKIEDQGHGSATTLFTTNWTKLLQHAFVTILQEEGTRIRSKENGDDNNWAWGVSAASGEGYGWSSGNRYPDCGYFISILEYRYHKHHVDDDKPAPARRCVYRSCDVGITKSRRSATWKLVLIVRATAVDWTDFCCTSVFTVRSYVG